MVQCWKEQKPSPPEAVLEHPTRKKREKITADWQTFTMTATALTMMTSSLITMCAETITILEPILARPSSSSAKPLHASVQAVQVSLKQLQDGLDQVPPTAIQEDVHSELLNALQSAADSLLAAKHVTAKFKGAKRRGPLERTWRSFRLGNVLTQMEIERTEKALESALTSLGLAATLVKRVDRPQAREGLLILLKGRERPKSRFLMSSMVPVSSSNSSMSCKSLLDIYGFLMDGSNFAI